MATIEVIAIVEVPEDANYEQTLAWVRFELGNVASLPAGNPLSFCDLEAKIVSIREV